MITLSIVLIIAGIYCNMVFYEYRVHKGIWKNPEVMTDLFWLKK